MKKPLKLTFIADTHHYSKTLGTSGNAYIMRSGSDQKCLGETGDIIDSAFNEIASSDTNAVIILGDLTNDGEVVSHNEMREKMYKLKEKKKVYAITATHDWCCDGNPRRFTGARVTHDVKTMKHNELRDFYYDFGPSEAGAEYFTHLFLSSYVVNLSDNVRLLALNDDQNGRGRAGFTSDHFDWIKEQIKKANDDNCLVIGIEHHLLIPHISPLITGGCCVGDREEVCSSLADAGLKYMFVGHSHIERIDTYESEKGNVLTEVNVGSLCGYPAPIVEVTVNDDNTLKIETKFLEKFFLNNIEVDANTYLKRHSLDVVNRVLNSSNKNDFEKKMIALQVNSKTVFNLFIVIKPLLKFIKNVTILDVYKKLKRLHLAKNINEKAVLNMKDKKVNDIVDEIFLSFLDGKMKYTKNDDYYKVVMGVINIFEKMAKNNNDMKKLVFAMEEILTGGKIDNNFAVI